MPCGRPDANPYEGGPSRPKSIHVRRRLSPWLCAIGFGLAGRRARRKQHCGAAIVFGRERAWRGGRRGGATATATTTTTTTSAGHAMEGCNIWWVQEGGGGGKCRPAPTKWPRMRLADDGQLEWAAFSSASLSSSSSAMCSGIRRVQAEPLSLCLSFSRPVTSFELNFKHNLDLRRPPAQVQVGSARLARTQIHSTLR